MDITFPKNVLLRAEAKTLHLHLWWCTVFLVLASLCCPSVECITLKDWDLAVAHGTQVSFISLNSNEKQDILIPVPTALNSTKNDKTSPSENGHLSHFTADSKSELFFFSFVDSNKHVSIIVFNITSNQTYSLPQKLGPEGFISGLVFHNGSLYWSESSNNEILRISLTDIFTKPEASREYEVVYAPHNGLLRGLAIDRKTNKFFWINKKGEDSSEFKIQYYDATDGKSGDVATILHYSPIALTTDESFLYWTEKRNTLFQIQRVLLTDFSDQEMIYSEHYHASYSLCVVCSHSIFWTESKDVRYVRRDSRGRIESKIFGSERFPQATRGIISRSSVESNWRYCKRNPTSTTPRAETTTLYSSTVHGSSNLSAETTTMITSSSSTTASVKDQANGSLNVNNNNIPVNVTSKTTESTTSVPVVSTPISKLTVGTTLPGPPNSTDLTERTIGLNASETKEIPDRETFPNSEAAAYYTPDVERNNLNLSWCPSEQNPCLNQGYCVLVVNRTVCICVSGYEGPNCENLRAQLPLVSTSDVIYIIACSGLSFLVVILLAVVIFLYVKIRRVDKKPRIRRRVIVSRSREGLRHRGREQDSSVCELIDIENCCNMNECETPCYETSGSNSSASSSKGTFERPSRKEDKERLIET